jgi:hypothetical protein
MPVTTDSTNKYQVNLFKHTAGTVQTSEATKETRARNNSYQNLPVAKIELHNHKRKKPGSQVSLYQQQGKKRMSQHTIITEDNQHVTRPNLASLVLIGTSVPRTFSNQQQHTIITASKRKGQPYIRISPQLKPIHKESENRTINTRAPPSAGPHGRNREEEGGYQKGTRQQDGVKEGQSATARAEPQSRWQGLVASNTEGEAAIWG